MKLIFATIFLLAVSSLAQCSRVEAKKLQGVPEIIDGIITSLLDKIKTALPDPLSIPTINLSLNAVGAANGTFLLENVLETGAKDFNVTNVETKILGSTINVVINVPSVNVNGDIATDLLFGTIVPLYGSGPFNIHLKNLKFNLTAGYKLNVLKLNLQLHDTVVVTSLEDAVFDLHGILDNEQFSVLISEVMNDNVAVFINREASLISTIASPIVEKVINAVLNKSKSSSLTQTEIENAGYEIVEQLKQHPKVNQYVNFH